MQIGSIEALKVQMEKCIVSDCKNCPYTDAQICDTAMTKDALEYIEQLEERIAIMQESMDALEKRCNALDALKQRCKTLEKRLDDSDRINVVRCSECQYWNPPTYAEQEDGSTIGHCTAALNGQQTDAYWFCADGAR